VRICFESNTSSHLVDYEGKAERRPMTREELQRFVDYADDQVEWATGSGRKGALSAYRDATMFKVIYGWGLRRTETAKLDITDWYRSPQAPELGKYGKLEVRWGKSSKGSPPKRRTVSCRRGRRGRRGLHGQRLAAVWPARPPGDVAD
jgi:integrase/recombinase XerC